MESERVSKRGDASKGEAPQDNRREDAISRRDFLRDAGGLFAFLLFARSSGGAQEAPQSPEYKKNYTEGLNDLQNKALHSNYEHVASYYHRGDRSTWEFHEQGGMSYAFVGTPELLAAALETAESLEMFHTHPLALIYRDTSILNAARRGEVPRMVMPPSFTDVTAAMITTAPLEKSQSDRVVWRLVDPMGVWTYTIDREHVYFEKIMQILRRADGVARNFFLEEDVRAFAQEHEGADPRLIFSMLQRDIRVLSPRSQTLLRDLLEVEAMLGREAPIKTIIEIESLRPGFAPDAPELAALRDAYAQIGVQIRFEARP